MALSHNLQTLSAWFNEVAEGRAEFTPESVRGFRSMLEEAVDDALVLEQVPFVVTGEMVPAKQVDNVVYLRPSDGRGKGGGDAA